MQVNVSPGLGAALSAVRSKDASLPFRDLQPDDVSVASGSAVPEVLKRLYVLINNDASRENVPANVSFEAMLAAATAPQPWEAIEALLPSSLAKEPHEALGIFLGIVEACYGKREGPFVFRTGWQLVEDRGPLIVMRPFRREKDRRGQGA